MFNKLQSSLKESAQLLFVIGNVDKKTNQPAET
jgi:hypothetical protein